MIPRPPVFLLVALTATLLSGCGLSHGRPTASSETVAPDDVLDFSVLFSRNCAGCHGVEGRGSVAIALASPEYLALADDATILQVVSHGRPGTPMPAFAKAAGGMLTEKQISVIVSGMRKDWGRATPLTSVALPPYAARSPGHPQAGSQLFEIYCGSCHGVNAPDGDPSILNPSFLALVSDQYLRTMVIVGRPELNAPDFRGNLSGHVMSDQEITDIVAWLSSRRTSTKFSQPGAVNGPNHPDRPVREGVSSAH